MKILTFDKFINEELIYNFGKLDPKTENTFKQTFLGDIMKLREFIQSNFPNQNLKYMGAGCVGLAFDWKGGGKLPNDFFVKGFYGNKTTSSENKVIKFTQNKGEISGSKRMIDLTSKGEIPHFATYYWVKEIDLSPSNIWSRTYGPPRPGQQMKFPTDKVGGKLNKEGEIELTPGKEVRSRHGDFLEDQDEENIKRFIDMKRKDNSVKSEKAYLVCLEKLTRLLNEKEKQISDVIRMYIFNQATNKSGFDKGPIDIDNIDKDKLESIYKFVMESDEEIIPEYGEKEIGIGMGMKESFRKAGITFGEFSEFVGKICEVYKSGLKLEIPVNDIHKDNMGYRGDELVAFDCM